MFYHPCRIFFHPTYKKRLSKILFSLIPENSFILDFGCGNGCISKQFASKKVICLDLKYSSNTKNFIQANGIYLPFKDKTFDVVIVVDVLHHTTDILKILTELKRVTKSYIIIKEQAYTSRLTKLLILLGDSITNRKCLFNHLHRMTWLEIFQFLHLTVEEEPKNLSFGFFLTEKMNQIWKLKV
jgi:ubiquinone/menaquinone biosynthesis C-methylase UbiE